MSITEEETESITWISINQDWEWYYFVPLLDRDEWQGIEYDSIQYGWDELDYRFGVDYPSIPESADAGFVGAILVGIFVAFCYFKNKKGK
tara:strand:- start:192 stop:461 length:270 start_codon:yes stop_codon:yes gene_type:complete